MKDTNEKLKRRLFLAGGLVICSALVVLIASQFRPADVPVANSSQSSQEESSSTGEQELFIETQAPASSAAEAGSPPPSASGPEQSIQAEPSKPEPPSEPPQVVDEASLEDPTSEPEYAEPTPQPSQPDEPKGGDTKDGKIYVPGFGWIEDIGEGQGTVDEEMYENGNKIGIM